MPVLDTNLLIRLHGGDQDARRTIEVLGDARLIVPHQAALEFALGATEEDLDILLSEFDVATSDAHILRLAGRLGRQARDDGRRVRTGDLWIAAHALARDDYVVSTNKRHFRQLGVDCWHWEEEAGPP